MGLRSGALLLLLLLCGCFKVHSLPSYESQLLSSNFVTVTPPAL